MEPIFIILSQGFSDWEIGVLAGVGRAFYDADIRFVSADGGHVTSVAGLKVGGLDRFDAPERGVVVVCGGPEFESENPPDISDRLRAAFDKGCTVAGICGGTMALARAGLLNTARHTSNGADYLKMAGAAYSGAAHYVDQPKALRDGRIITAAAPQPASFASEVLAAAGVPDAAVAQIGDMLGREHLG